MEFTAASCPVQCEAKSPLGSDISGPRPSTVMMGSDIRRAEDGGTEEGDRKRYQELASTNFDGSFSMAPNIRPTERY